MLPKNNLFGIALLDQKVENNDNVAPMCVARRVPH